MWDRMERCEIERREITQGSYCPDKGKTPEMEDHSEHTHEY